MKERYKSTVTVSLVLTRKNEKNKEEVLLQRRYNTGYMDGKYDTACSGHLEKDESLLQALVREASEEIGIKVDEKDLEFVSIIHCYSEGYINFFFKTDKYENIPTICEKNKCDDLRWFELDSLPEDIIPKVENVLKNIKLGIIYDDENFKWGNNSLC